MRKMKWMFAAAVVLSVLSACDWGMSKPASAPAPQEPAATNAAVQTASTNAAITVPAGDIMMICDFNQLASNKLTNTVGGIFGAWNKDPKDPSQFCKMSIVEPGVGGNGKCVKLNYSVESESAAYNGLYMKLQNADFSKYSKLVFWLKGDAKDGFTKKFKIELKDASATAPYYVTDVSDSWAEVVVPFEDLYQINDWTKMKEFTVVFEDSQATKKKGTIYIDNIYLAK